MEKKLYFFSIYAFFCTIVLICFENKRWKKYPKLVYLMVKSSFVSLKLF